MIGKNFSTFPFSPASPCFCCEVRIKDFSPHCIAKIGLGEAIEAARRMKEESSGNEGAL
jgi:hypothetical protein